MRLAVLAVALAVVIGVAVATAEPTTPPATVFAAASLTDAFPKIAPRAHLSFTGSNTLAAQIRQGAPADVFAAANMRIPRELSRDGFCSKPVVFTRNALVLIVPRSNPAHTRTVSDLRRKGIKLVLADKGVPVGDYTVQVLQKLRLTGVLKNVVSRETDVREVLAKVALGEADAGFVYATDAKIASRRVRVIAIPRRGRPNVEYGICIVRASHGKPAAQAFVKRVLGPAGQKALRHYGFLTRKP